MSSSSSSRAPSIPVHVVPDEDDEVVWYSSSSDEDSDSINCSTLSQTRTLPLHPLDDTDDDDEREEITSDLDLSTVKVKCDCCKLYVRLGEVTSHDDRMAVFFELNSRVAELCSGMFDLFSRAYRLRRFFSGMCTKFIVRCEAWFQRYVFRMGLFVRASASVPAPFIICEGCHTQLREGIRLIDSNTIHLPINDDEEL